MQDTMKDLLCCTLILACNVHWHTQPALCNDIVLQLQICLFLPLLFCLLPVVHPILPANSVPTHLVRVHMTWACLAAGRAGRVRPGLCFRLCTQEDFQALPDSSVPEMQRCELASTVLQLKAMGIDNIMKFDWLAPPPAETMIRALELLHALGALGADARQVCAPLHCLHSTYTRLTLILWALQCWAVSVKRASKLILMPIDIYGGFQQYMWHSSLHGKYSTCSLTVCCLSRLAEPCSRSVIATVRAPQRQGWV